jgi:hypothetical protein
MKVLYCRESDFAVIQLQENKGSGSLLDLDEHYDAAHLQAPRLALEFADEPPDPAPAYLTAIYVADASQHLSPMVLTMAEALSLDEPQSNGGVDCGAVGVGA